MYETACFALFLRYLGKITLTYWVFKCMWMMNFRVDLKFFSKLLDQQCVNLTFKILIFSKRVFYQRVQYLSFPLLSLKCFEEVAKYNWLFHSLDSGIISCIMKCILQPRLGVLYVEVSPEVMVKLEGKFRKSMRELADLSEEKQRLEHLVLQLQSETETIGKENFFQY